jgi:hypothetical protein
MEPGPGQNILAPAPAKSCCFTGSATLLSSVKNLFVFVEAMEELFFI